MLLAGGETGSYGPLWQVGLGGQELEAPYSSAIPDTVMTISVGRLSENILMNLFQTSSDDLVVCNIIDFDYPG